MPADLPAPSGLCHRISYKPEPMAFPDWTYCGREIGRADPDLLAVVQAWKLGMPPQADMAVRILIERGDTKA